MSFVAHAHDPKIFAAIAGLALAGGIAQLALTGALRLAPVSRWSCRWIIRRCCGRASSACCCSAEARPSHWTWVGAPIVIAAGLVILWREQRLRITRNAVAAVPEVSE